MFSSQTTACKESLCTCHTVIIHKTQSEAIADWSDLAQEALVPALDALTAEQFEWAMSLVHARYPGLPSGPGEEMQFDITCLDSLALRQLMDFTQACAKAAQVCATPDLACA